MITHSNHSNSMTSQGRHTPRGDLALFFHSFAKNSRPPFSSLHSSSLVKTTGKTNDVMSRGAPSTFPRLWGRVKASGLGPWRRVGGITHITQDTRAWRGVRTHETWRRPRSTERLRHRVDFTDTLRNRGLFVAQMAGFN